MTAELVSGEFEFNPPHNIPGGTIRIADAKWWECSECHQVYMPGELSAQLDAVAKQRKSEDTAIRVFKGEHAFLSNFAPCRLVMDGVSFQTAEQAFQYQKVLSDKDKLAVLNAPNAGIARFVGRNAKEIRSDWEDRKLDIMSMVLRCKFCQNPAFRGKLLATGNRLLVEGNDWGDTYWGVCRGEGENNLGKLLMLLRSDLIENDYDISSHT